MYENNYMAHFGIKGQRWGVRRFQNEDGTLTRAGIRKYQKQESDSAGKAHNNKAIKKDAKTSAQIAKIKKRYKTAGILVAGLATLVAADFITASLNGEKNLVNAGKLAVAATKVAVATR